MNCEKEQVEINIYPNVDRPLCPYFQQFEKEAAARGLIIDLKAAHISGSLTTIRQGYVGVCANAQEKQILIDQGFWESSSALSKELIVFHELGHCFLNRKHTNEVAANGTCLSIMRSGKGGCLDYYTSKTRSQLLDELFQYE